MGLYQFIILSGIVAAFFFMLTIIVGATKIIPAKKRLKTHKRLAITASVAAIIHILLILRLYLF